MNRLQQEIDAPLTVNAFLYNKDRNVVCVIVGLNVLASELKGRGTRTLRLQCACTAAKSRTTVLPCDQHNIDCGSQHQSSAFMRQKQPLLGTKAHGNEMNSLIHLVPALPYTRVEYCFLQHSDSAIITRP